MSDEHQNPPSHPVHPGDAWLEEALLLAASELAAFRVTAQAERDRLNQAVEAAKAQVKAIEATLGERESQHAAEVAELRELIDKQLGQRESAWAQFSEGVRERLSNLAAAQAQHAQDMEEQSSLRRQLHNTREQVEASQQTQAELEKRLGASEEAFALAAQEKSTVQNWGMFPIWAPSQGDDANVSGVSGARARAAGLHNRPVRETIRDLLAWWKTLPAERTANMKAGMSAAQEAELIALWKKQNA